MRLYIDPGTGSMLFSIAIGLVSVLWFGVRKLWMKIKYAAPGRAKADENVIPLVIFSDDKRYWPVFEPVVRELDSRGFDVTYMTSSPDDPALQAQYPHLKAEFIGTGNKAFARLNLLKATILLSTTPGLDVYQWKRSKDVKWYVHIPHMPGELITYRMFGVDFYDALLLSGQYQIDDNRALEKLREEPEKECVIVGIPYMDEKLRRLRETPEPPHAETTVLLSPSWGSSSILNRFGSKAIDALLETGYRIIIRPHPQSFTSEKEMIDQLMQQYPNSGRLEWNRDTDNFEVLRRSDVMVSDFSGVVLEFALAYDKPVICAYTGFDKSPYDAWWLETPIWTATAIPRIGRILSEENLPDLKTIIDECLTDQLQTDSRHQVINETWAHPGEGAIRTVDYLIEKYQELCSESESK